MAQNALSWQVLLMNYMDTPLGEVDAAAWDYERRVNQVGAAHLTLSPASGVLTDAWDLSAGKWLQFRCRYQDDAGVWQTTREDWGGPLVARTLQVPEGGVPATRYGLTAYDWKHYLRLRLINPPAGLEYLDLGATHAGDAIRTAWLACFDHASGGRLLNHFSAVSDTGLVGLGGSVAYSARYERLYDVITTLAGQGAIKFDVARIPPVGAALATLQIQGFAPLQGVDRTIGNGLVAPVVFSVDLQAIATLDYSEDASTIANAVTGGGNGDAAARLIALSSDPTSIGRYEQQEYFQDVRGAGTLAAVQASGAAYVALHKDPEITFQMTLAQTSGPVYKRDWDLGDKVSVRLSDLGLTLDLEITSVKVSSIGDPGAPATVTPTFGTPRRNLVDRIGNLSQGLTLRATH